MRNATPKGGGDHECVKSEKLEKKKYEGGDKAKHTSGPFRRGKERLIHLAKVQNGDGNSKKTASAFIKHEG